MIKKHGWAAEHNYRYYQYYQYYQPSYKPPTKNIFVEADHGALFTAYDSYDNSYFVVFDPMAPTEFRVPILMEYIEWIFSNTQASKIWFQLDTSFRRSFLKSLPESFRSCRIYYTLTWPVYDLRQFDPELKGGHYKTLRKEHNKFYREHVVTVEDAKKFLEVSDKGKQDLYEIIENWKKRRLNNDQAMTGVYKAMIDGHFEGMDEARIFIVDGRPVGFNAGWMIPNSERFYGAVGIHDYSHEDLGAMLYLEDMIYLKNKGYLEADMGGSVDSVLAFKKKFCPNSFYKSAIFSVVREGTNAKKARVLSGSVLK
jgi:hypothetical protein